VLGDTDLQQVARDIVAHGHGLSGHADAQKTNALAGVKTAGKAIRLV
jgi:hypothetical protein